MKTRKITGKFLNLEKDNNLFEIEIKNHYVWNYLRNEISDELFASLQTHNVAPERKSLKESTLNFLKDYLLPYITPAHIDLKEIEYLIFNYGGSSEFFGHSLDEQKKRIRK
mgnify:CR=1 FL=1